ncbi:MAG: DnaJ domain-containing protein [Spirochaetales bacterium]|nr:DnaJ domain-containing protein [Spirochaetales bacterium]
MSNYPDYYRILGVPANAGVDVIRYSFRHLAKIHHPDKNGNSPDSQLVFRVILEAYRILSTAKERSLYDDYLRSSTVVKKRKTIKHAAAGRCADRTVSDIISRLNFILWEIEDLLAGSEHEPQEVILILSFFDKWILTPSGNGDYFFTARQINKIDVYKPSSGSRDSLHSPYVNLRDYFYQIRRRFDRFMNNLRKSELASVIPGTEVTLLDGIFEATRLSYYYLGRMNITRAGGVPGADAFHFSNYAFDEEGETHSALPSKL